MRSAFGFGGQKCSANSRVYAERPVHDELVRRLVEKTERLVVGNPLERPVFMGPLIDQAAVDRHQQAVPRRSATDGVHRREHLTDGAFARGFYVSRRWSACRPRTACSTTSCSHRSRRSRPSISMDEALALANAGVYGLTAGVYSEDRAEVDRFLEEVHAGVLYVNRRAGATTGAWPAVQAFGGWKGSGSTGKSGLSMYYVAQFLREQSHTVVD